MFKPVELLDRVENFSAPPQLFIMLVMECAVVELFWSLFIYNLHTNIVYGDIFQCSLFLSLYIQIAKLESRHFFFLPYLIWRKCILKKKVLFLLFLMSLKANTNNNKHLGNRRKIIIFIHNVNVFLLTYSETKLYGDRIISF